MRKIGVVCLIYVTCALILQTSALPARLDGHPGAIDSTLRYSRVLPRNYFADVTNVTFGGNTTRVSVITATPQVTTIAASVITATISVTTATVSISTEGGQRNFYLEASIVIIVAVILGALAFARKRKSAITD